MLTDKRHKLILDALSQHQFLTLQQLMNNTHSSASTIRRDLTKLQKEGKLTRVHGGAKLVHYTEEPELGAKRTQNIEDKILIAQQAAELINDGDCIYLDAGSTTLEMISYIEAQDITVVTNGLTHIEKLLSENIKTLMIGGEVKPNTLAIVGVRAIHFLQNYHFDKVFLGVNGIDPVRGLTTPDEREASIKEMAMKQGQQTYVLADKSKFNQVYFASIHETDEAPIIITNPSTMELEQFQAFEERYEFLGGQI
ncbi:DeoR family transcriptional regulator [Staphylococcus felis]|uniref:DeoR/GlpR family DNA-binding transcription regulator n=1 Tax=Staphylococcus felis TaxID=46127 RepID=UPI000E2815D1|nr:DeoR/GlpR family DNA-binding transcription regulator [Staphylococcus felis]REH98073.1 DeoR family transcriptional regulator [Staphylococcus felis]REI03221.1 DeoR family transcriptional regulator [Staphylococcus felis]REI20514.1 DeoR family transcriptional regulator [Staphylococcus felis]REI33107.1 DeoR family transcriptional regulator [Staphylococcus felis]